MGASQPQVLRFAQDDNVFFVGCGIGPTASFLFPACRSEHICHDHREQSDESGSASGD